MEPSASRPQWRVLQRLGEVGSHRELDDVTALRFRADGAFAAVGDGAGNLRVLRTDAAAAGGGCGACCDFKAQEAEFDCLKSVEIEERINGVSWVPHAASQLLTCNDKTVKLWSVRSITGSTRGARRGGGGGGCVEQQRRVFSNAHGYSINALSCCSDGETFLTADDLRINVWSLERADECLNALDCKPGDMETLSEVITAAAMHPTHCHILAYSTSAGTVNLHDLRQRALCDSALAQQFRQGLGGAAGGQGFFSEIAGCISDFKFGGATGRAMATRDFLRVTVWDTAMPGKPVCSSLMREDYPARMAQMYNEDRAFDQFSLSFSGSGEEVATGLYGGLVRTFSATTGELTGEVCVHKEPPQDHAPVLHVAWNSSSDSILAAYGQQSCCIAR